MTIERNIITVRVDAIRYRGAYYKDGDKLVVEASGLGIRSMDASILGDHLGAPAKKMAKLMLHDLVKEGTQTNLEPVILAQQGSTTQINLTG